MTISVRPICPISYTALCVYLVWRTGESRSDTNYSDLHRAHIDPMEGAIGGVFKDNVALP